MRSGGLGGNEGGKGYYERFFIGIEGGNVVLRICHDYTYLHQEPSNCSKKPN